VVAQPVASPTSSSTAPRSWQLLGEPKDLVNEAQARELAALKPEDAQKVWLTVEKTAEETHKPVTANLIRQVRGRSSEPNGGVGGETPDRPAGAGHDPTRQLVLRAVAPTSVLRAEKRRVSRKARPSSVLT
jgi:hypothetical protein